MVLHYLIFLLSTLPVVCVSASDKNSRADFGIAIDVGHSTQRPGATSARGVSEYVFNRRLAELLLAELHKANFKSTFLISEAKQDIPLAERTEIARKRNAQLLLSLHHDSVQPLYLESWVHKGEKQQFSNRYSGFSLFYSEKNRQSPQSLQLAQLLGKRFLEKGMAPTLHHAEPIAGENRELVDSDKGIYRFDDLIILKTAEMPAVLIESGIIVNREEEELLNQPAYRNKLVRAIVSAVEDYLRAGSNAKERQKKEE